jgi:hypothetical protein
MVMCQPALRKAVLKGINSANSIGSPPVSTTCLVVEG